MQFFQLPNLKTATYERKFQSRLAAMDFSGMSVNAFALHIGLPWSENLYQIKKGNHGISKALAETIHRFYPQYGVGWLLSGSTDAPMPGDREKIDLRHDVIRRIPIYHDLKELARPLYQVYLSESLIKESQAVVISTDAALVPRIVPGSMVFVKPVRNIISGNLYVVVTDEFALIRRVTAAEDDKVVLSAVDRENYADFTLNRSEIMSLYSVEKVFAD